MKFKFLLISMLLILVLSIGAISAADVNAENDLNSDISMVGPVDSVESDGFDYAGDSIDTNASDSSDILGVGEEDDVLGTGVFNSIVFPDAVDGVITWDDMNHDYYIQWGYSTKMLRLDILDAHGEHIEITSYKDWEFEYDGFPADKNWEDYKDEMEYITNDLYNDQGFVVLNDILYLVGLYDDDGRLLYDYVKLGNHTLTIYNKDKSFSQSVKIVMLEPKYVKATVTTGDIITVNVTTNDGPGNFTVYVADNIVANGTVDANGTGSVSFDAIYGKNTLKVILDGATKKGLNYQQTINIVKFELGSFSDLSNKIANATGVLDLPYDFKLNPGESELFQNGISINKNLTINGNGHTINATCSDGTGARVFDVSNMATFTLNNATLVGAGYGNPNGGAIVGASYVNIIVNNVIFSENKGNYGGAIFINQYSNLTATNVTFTKNRAVSGSGIFAQKYNTIKLNNVLFENESSTSSGGNIYLNGYSDVDIKNSTFRNFYLKKNSVCGGSIQINSHSNVNISDCSFENFTLEMQSAGSRYRQNNNNGGVIYCQDYVILNITGTTFKNNKNLNPGSYSYSYSSGIIYSKESNSYTYISDCEFINNTAQQGVIYTRNADIIGCLFENNSATNDYPVIYYDEKGKGTVSYNAFLGDVPTIRMMKNGEVSETTNWWGTNTPGENLVRKVNDYVDPNNYIVMNVYNSGNTAYAALTRDSTGNFIENPELLPVRTAIFESSQTTSADTVDGVAAATVTDSQVNVTIDGQTMTLFMAPGNVTSIQIVAVENTTVGADGKVYFILSGDNGPVDGKLTVISNNHSYDVEVSNGFAIADIGGDFDAGAYDIYYIYEGSTNYAAINTKTKAEEQFGVYKSDVIITIDREKNIITFNVAGDNTVIPTGTINVTVGDINKILTLSNGAASYNYGNDLGPGVYDVNVTYAGDKNNNGGSLVTTFEIIKNTVEITFTNATNTLTFNLTGVNGVVPTGKIIVTLGNSTQTLTLNNKGLASFDFGKVLAGGEYNLTVNYTGDDYYNPGLMEDTFEIVKMTPTIELTIRDINMTQGDNNNFVIKVVGDENVATGYVYLIVNGDSYRRSLSNGMASFSYGNKYKAGSYNVTVTYEGDGYYYATEYTHNETLNVLPKITIKAPSEVYSEQAPLIISIDPVDVNGTLIVKMDGVELYFDEIAGGYLYLTLSNLEEGEHTFEAYYGGNDKYMPNSATVTTTVSFPELPQWGQTGYDYTNGGQSPYARLNEVMEIWNYTADKGSSTNDVPTLLIDAEGNIYVAFNRKVTSLYADGSERWINTNGRWGGEAIDANGHMITPQSGNAFNYLRISDGVCPNSWGYFYYGSSSYAPVIGPDGVIYVSYEYSYPYSGSYTDPTAVWGDRRWIGLVNPDLSYRGTGSSLIRIEGIAYGSQPHVAPVTIDNLGNLWHTSTSGLRGVIIGTGEVVFEDANIGTRGRPVVDANNIVYVFGGEDQIYAVTAAGVLWNTTVTDGSGSTMVVGKDSEYILSINCEGVLYKYDVTNGKETKIYDFETTVSTALMTDANGVIYVGDDDGTFWALTDDGTVLWTFDAGSAITARPVMDKNGVIYIYTADNVLYALGFNKVNSSISLEVNDTTTVDGLVAVATLNDDATGKVIFILNNETEFNVEIVNGTATLIVEQILAGEYNITAIYDGNYAYNGNETSSSFTVTKVDPVIDIMVPIIFMDENGIVYIIIENATGNVTVEISGVDFIANATLEDGIANVTLPVLKAGNYNITVTYDGDDTYFNSTETEKFDVFKYDPEMTVNVDNITVIENATVTVTVTNATGNVTVKVGDDEKTAVLENGSAVIVLDLLDAGTHNITVTYNGDDTFEVATAETSVDVSKIDTPLFVDIDDAEAFDDIIIYVEVVEYATGNITVTIDGKNYTGEISNESIAEIIVPGLPAGEYSALITYDGNDKVFENSTTEVFTVDKIYYYGVEVIANVSAITNGTITVILPENATGEVSVYIDETYSANITDGIAVIDVPNFVPGEYDFEVYYAGDDNYEYTYIDDSFTVVKEDLELDVTIENNTVIVEVPEGAEGYILVEIGDAGYFATIKDGVAKVKVLGLDEGNYTAAITYTGDITYNPANTTVNMTVVPTTKDPQAEINISEEGILMELPEDATGYMLIDVDGTGYYTPVNNGEATFELPELAPGNHTISVIYTGDRKYDSANATQNITIEGPVETIISEDLTKVEKAPDRFEAVFIDEMGDLLINETVSFTLNGVTYNRTTDASGKAGMNINLIAGNYSITIINPVTGEVKVNNITVLPRIVENNNLVKYFRNASQFVVKVLDDEGNPVQAGEVVTFNINGVFYNRTTNSSGQVKLSINLNPGEYVITTSYKGCVAANNVTVLPTLTASDLTKKYGEPGAFEAKLVDAQGNALANTEVTFNINGVLYKRSTNASGIAKLNINLVAGEYVITTMANGAVISNKVTITP